MDATIISALIAAGAALLVCMINNHHQQEAARKQHNETITLIDYRLKQLEHKVELHNNAVFRLTKVETKVEDIEKSINN